MSYILSILVGYLLGCIQTSYLISTMIYGFDIRKKGTENAGASNMVTTVGWSAGLLTMCIDILKSYVAVKFISMFIPTLLKLYFFNT